ncbi:MAG: DNA helicase PcrA [Clostridia bacterium]|nr:DNA helicase PcrA [Clostridia bacterium]
MDLSGLNREQRLAVETLEGPVLILAGAGSGKTRALTARVANLIDHGVRAWNILALTFTNKAAKEMKTRIAQLVGNEAADDAWISTFHSTCARILRRDIEKLGYARSFGIYDDDDQTTVLKEILKRLNIDDKYIPIREVKGKISDAKNKLFSPDEWFMQSPRDHRSSQIHDIMVEYEKRLKSLNALDFDDLLIKTLELLADHPPVLESYRQRFQYVLVDEYQDTNKAQYELVRLLTEKSRNLCVVGDDDQSIYGWRGADIRNILDFEKDYPDAQVIKLEQNYRSTSTILDAANQVIAHNTDRKDKQLWTQISEGEKIKVFAADDERDEAAWIADSIRSLTRGGEKMGDVAILYRTNAQSRVLEEMLMRASIPYKVFGGQKFYDRKEIKDIIAYLRVIVNPSDDISLRRIINVPRRSIGDSTVQELASHAEKNDMPLYSALSDLPAGLGSRPRKCVTDFFTTMTLLSALKDSLPLEEFVQALIQQTGLREQYVRENSDEAQTRIENMDEFMGAIHEFAQMTENPTLESYLENVALVTDLDRAEDDRGYVTLMTLHSAKGLEFRNVFIAGVEENIFPSSRSVNEDARLEEERRLMYVGITRARQRLFLSRARNRTIYNQVNFNPPSRFLSEIPDRLLDAGISRREAAFGKTPLTQTRTGYSGRSMSAPRPQMPMSQIGKPKLTFQGKNLDQIPGVSKGFAPSKAREGADSAMSRLFQAGERVLHRKFGAGVVREIHGTGADARIVIAFTAYGEKEFSLSIAPIVKLED